MPSGPGGGGRGKGEEEAGERRQRRDRAGLLHPRSCIVGSFRRIRSRVAESSLPNRRIGSSVRVSSAITRAITAASAPTTLRCWAVGSGSPVGGKEVRNSTSAERSASRCLEARGGYPGVSMGAEVSAAE
jgi:hypothetical protein